MNGALDELVGYAAACHKSMAMVGRNQLGRVTAEERQRMHDLHRAVEVKREGGWAAGRHEDGDKGAGKGRGT